MVLKYEPLRDAVRALRAASAAGLPRVRADGAGPAVRSGAGARAGGSAGIAARVRAVRGDRRAVHRGGGPGRAVARRLRAERRRAGGGGRDRCGHAALAGRARATRARTSRIRSRRVCSIVRSTRGRRSPTVGQVPPVLLGGDHEAIRRWRLKQALGRTWLRRPELLAKRALTDEERQLLAEFKAEWLELNSRG